MSAIILLSFLLFSFIRGYRKGIISVSFGLAGLFSAYLMAYLMTKPVAEISIALGLQSGFLAYIFPGIIIFFFFYLSFSIAGWLAHRAVLRGRTRKELPVFYWLSGAFLSSFIGIIYGLALVWSFGQLQPAAARDGWVDKMAINMMDTISGTFTKSIFEGNPVMAEKMTQIITNPQDSAIRLKKMTEAPQFTTFFHDSEVQKALETGDVASLTREPAFKHLLQNQSIKEQLGHFGFYPEKDPQANQILAEQLITLWQHATKLKNHPRAQEILNAPDFKKLLMENNILGLLKDSRSLELAKILSQPEALHTAPGEAPKTQEPNFIQNTEIAQDMGSAETENKGKKLYSWHDESGKLFISDTPPPKHPEEKAR